MLDWSSVCSLKIGSYVDPLDSGVAVEKGVYKFSDSQYFLVDSVFEGAEEKLKLFSVFWACSESAFRRAYFKDIENDDMTICLPPAELLPCRPEMNYASIRNYLKNTDPAGFLEYASYRVMSDGAFIHKGLESLRAIYYFRSAEIVDSELPYAIMLR